MVIFVRAVPVERWDQKLRQQESAVYFWSLKTKYRRETRW